MGVCIPCAITAEAVAYYKDLVNKYGKQTVKRHQAPSSDVNYQASTIFKKEFIIDGKTFNDVNVITLKLAFNQSFCASGTEGMHIKKERIVIVDDAGIVLHISGDGPTGVPIFAKILLYQGYPCFLNLRLLNSTLDQMGIFSPLIANPLNPPSIMV